MKYLKLVYHFINIIKIKAYKKKKFNDNKQIYSAAKKPRAQKGHKLAEKFPKGEVMQDLWKKKWVLGDVIGQGGFGLIYLGVCTFLSTFFHMQTHLDVSASGNFWKHLKQKKISFAGLSKFQEF